LARSTKTEHRARFKARIVLMAADGAATRAIARALGCTIGTASKWRVRFAKDRIAGFTEVGDRAAEAGLSGILCAGPVAPSRLNEPFVEHDSELGLSFAPFARRHFPCLRDLAQDEIQELRRGVVGGKMPSCAHGRGAILR
jgi:Homeodomain-like domain-containing protein